MAMMLVEFGIICQSIILLSICFVVVDTLSLESLESRGIITPLEAYMGGSFIGLHRGKAVTPRRLPQEQERIWVGKTTIVHHSGHSSGV